MSGHPLILVAAPGPVAGDPRVRRRRLRHDQLRLERRWCLAMGHGFYHGPRRRPERSSPIFADEIEASGWDYVALGHHHLRTDVSQGRVMACYPGAPLVAWDHPDPDGTVLVVDLAEDAGVRVSPRPIV